MHKFNIAVIATLFSFTFAVVSTVAWADSSGANLSLSLPLSGRVTGPDGAPIGNVPVHAIIRTLVYSRGTSETQIHAVDVKTDAAGKFVINGVQPGDNVRMFVSRPGYRFLSGGEISATPSGFTSKDIVVAPPTSQVTGRVATAQGAAVADGVVVAPGSNPQSSASIGADGAFMLTNVPLGDTRLIAITKEGIGTVTVTAPSNGASISVSPQVRPTESNVDRSRSIVKSALALLLDNAPAGEADRVLMSLAPFDPDGALRLAQSQNTAPQFSLAVLLAVAQLAPGTAKGVASDLLDKMPDAGQRAMGAAVVGLVNASSDSRFARQMLDRAKTELKSASFNYYVDVDVVTVAGLAARLHDRSADDLYNSAVKALKDNTDLGASDKASILASYAEAVAPGGSAIAERAIDEAAPPPKDARADYGGVAHDLRIAVRTRAVKALAQYDAADAAEMLRGYDSSDKGAPLYGQAVVAVIEGLNGRDPAAASTLADSVTDQMHKPLALALAAQGQDAATASGLYRRAFAAALQHQNRAAVTGWVCALAQRADPQLGADLFERGWLALKANANSTDDTAGLFNLSAFAFYYGALDQVRSRQAIEADFGLATSRHAESEPATYLAPILAMTGIDVDRALEMTKEIPRPLQVDALRKIAQYVAASPEVKATLRFDRWIQDDTWRPGTPSGD